MSLASLVRRFILVTCFCGLVAGGVAVGLTGLALAFVPAFAFAVSFVGAAGVAILNTRRGNDLVVRWALKQPGREDALCSASSVILPPDEFLDAICARAREGTDADVSYISFVFPDRQFFKGMDSMPEGFDHLTELGLEDSICRLVAVSQEPLAVPDTTKARHVRVCGPVKAGLMGSYLGAPIHFRGHVLGALAVVGAKARDWGRADCETLLSLAEQVSQELRERNV